MPSYQNFKMAKLKRMMPPQQFLLQQTQYVLQIHFFVSFYGDGSSLLPLLQFYHQGVCCEIPFDPTAISLFCIMDYFSIDALSLSFGSHLQFKIVTDFIIESSFQVTLKKKKCSVNSWL